MGGERFPFGLGELDEGVDEGDCIFESGGGIEEGVQEGEEGWQVRWRGGEGSGIGHDYGCGGVGVGWKWVSEEEAGEDREESRGEGGFAPRRG